MPLFMHLAQILGVLLLSFPVHAQELDAGFIQGVWYANEPVIAGEPTRVYVALRNNSNDDLTGTVRFTDNGTRIGAAQVSALPGRIVEAWVDWTPGYGEHTVAASLTNVQIHPIGELPKTSAVTNTVAQNAVFVDHDTDKDSIPNQKDTDDDNDGVSDEAETTRGTNPLKAEPKSAEEKKEEQREEKEPLTPLRPTVEDRDDANGLEKYVPDGTAQTVMASLTENIAETKSSLDEYRDKRNNALKDYFSNSTTTTLSSPASSDMATITRSKGTNNEGFFESVTHGSKALLSGMYALLLSILSKLLSYPALIELLLLFFMIYAIYRIARRFGRRRRNL